MEKCSSVNRNELLKFISKYNKIPINSWAVWESSEKEEDNNEQ